MHSKISNEHAGRLYLHIDNRKFHKNDEGAESCLSRIALSICKVKLRATRVLFRMRPASGIQEGSKTDQSCNAEFGHVDTPSGFTRVFQYRPRKHLHSARCNMPAEELGTTFKSNDRIQVNSPSLHCTFPLCLFLKIP